MPRLPYHCQQPTKPVQGHLRGLQGIAGGLDSLDWIGYGYLMAGGSLYARVDVWDGIGLEHLHVLDEVTGCLESPSRL